MHLTFQASLLVPRRNRRASTKHVCQTSMTAGQPRPQRRAVRLPRPSLVFVTPDAFSRDIPKAAALTKAVLDGGVSLVQVRDRNGSLEDISRVVHGLLEEGIPARSLVVNGMDPEHVLAMGEGLGIHIKEKDIPTYLPSARDILPPETIIGCAVHSAAAAEEVMNLQEPKYFQVGTMFATMSHPGKIPEGPQLLQNVRAVVGESPSLIGIGGIEPDNVSEIIEHGGDGIAVVSLLAKAKNPSATAADLLQRCQQAFSVGRAS